MDQGLSPDAPQPPESEEARRSNITNWLLAGILIVVVAIGAFTFFGNNESDTPDASFLDGAASTTTTADPGVTTTLATTDTTMASTTTTTEATTTTTTTMPAEEVELTPEQQAAADAVTAWVAAIAAGDRDGAWNLVAKASQDTIGTESDFAEIFSGLVEGIGEWSEASDVTMFVNPVAESGEGSLMVVTMAGTVSQEGVTAQRAVAIPVFLDTGGVAEVQPFLRGDGLIEFVTPIEIDPPYGFGDTPTFDFTVPGQPMVLLFVDATEVTRVTIDRSADSSRVTASPAGVLEPGLYVLTVIYLDEGIQHAEAVLFTFGEGS